MNVPFGRSTPPTSTSPWPTDACTSTVTSSAAEMRTVADGGAGVDGDGR